MMFNSWKLTFEGKGLGKLEMYQVQNERKQMDECTEVAMV